MGDRAHGASPGNADRLRARLDLGQVLAGDLRHRIHALFGRARNDDGIAQAEGAGQARFEFGMAQRARHDLDAHDAEVPRLLQEAADLPAVEPGFRGDVR
jgi:hypothetical protein